MLAIKRTLIPSPMYMYAAIAAASFVVTFGILSVARPQFGSDQAASDSNKVAQQSQGNTSKASGLKVADSSDKSVSGASAVTQSQRTSAATVQPTIAPSPPTVAPTVATSEPSTAFPVSTGSSSQPAIPAESVPAPVTPTPTQPQTQEDASLLGEVLGGLGGVVDALL